MCFYKLPVIGFAGSFDAPFDGGIITLVVFALSVCLSDCLSLWKKLFTLAITFECYLIELSYLHVYCLL